MKFLNQLLIAIMALAVFIMPKNSLAISSGACNTVTLEQIPVQGLDPPILPPLPGYTLTQKYNTSFSEGFCFSGGTYAHLGEPGCDSSNVLYGHDGLDLHVSGSKKGESDVISVTDGLVIFSVPVQFVKGWGESIIIAARANLYSEEIITFHYHHLHSENEPDQLDYFTSRVVGKCERVWPGQVIGKEGGTPYWATHLHFTVRRWNSISQMKNAMASPGSFFGSGYVNSSTSKLANYLNPHAFLTANFLDFSSQTAATQENALEIFARGIELGNYNGSFGLSQNVTRGEMAKYAKIIAKLPSAWAETPTFFDVDKDNKNFPYIEKLVKYPLWPQPAISPTGNCSAGQPSFCPESEVSKAQAVKMLVLAKFPQEFGHVFANKFWFNLPDQTLSSFSQLSSLSPMSWHFSYFYFAWQYGLLWPEEMKNPDSPLTRKDLVNWLGRLMNKNDQTYFTVCGACQYTEYCNEKNMRCEEVPRCNPSEYISCPLGGGVDSNPTSPVEDAGAPAQDAGSSPSLSQDGGSEVPFEDSGSNSCPPNTCTPGEFKYSVCPDSNGTIIYSISTCSQSCIWVELRSCNVPATPIEDAGTPVQDAGSSSSPSPEAGSVPIEDSGTPDSDYTNPVEDSGPSIPGSGNTTCSNVWQIGSGDGCNSNLQSNGSPTLCLSVTQSGSNFFDYTICKQGGDFINQAYFELYDDNHVILLQTGQISPGFNCSQPQTVSLAHVTQTGSQNGAGLKAKIFSPSSCQDQSCLYYTGYKTIYLSCQ